jgi:predicted DsbA family dithiol-disulfide isomerase
LIKKKIDQPEILISYFTDPSCVWSWAIEPKIRRLLEEYGGKIRILYKMGGLMEKWTGYQDPENRITKPSQMAPRWADVARRTGMPIDERIWREDPPDSTYPPCIAFKAAEFQGARISVRYLRRLREAVFLERKNTAREEVLFRLAKEVGLDVERFQKDFKEGRAESAFRQDLEDAREQFILGFPTLLFRGTRDREAKLYGYLEYDSYRRAIDDVWGSPVKRNRQEGIAAFVRKYHRVLLPEVAELFHLETEEAAGQLEMLKKRKQLRRKPVGGGGFLWEAA